MRLKAGLRQRLHGAEDAGIGLDSQDSGQSTLFNLLTDVKLDFNAADFRIKSRKVCDEIVHLDERDAFLRGMFAWLGFRTETV